MLQERLIKFVFFFMFIKSEQTRNKTQRCIYHNHCFIVFLFLYDCQFSFHLHLKLVKKVMLRVERDMSLNYKNLTLNNDDKQSSRHHEIVVAKRWLQ